MGHHLEIGRGNADVYSQGRNGELRVTVCVFSCLLGEECFLSTWSVIWASFVIYQTSRD